MMADISIDYDKGADLLYLNLGENIAGYEEKLADNIYLRKSLADDKVIGADIYHVSQVNLKNAIEKLPFKVNYETISGLY